jgi:hypothetical protein
MEETKPWYVSKTIWSGLTTSVIAILIGVGAIPERFSEGFADEAALLLLGLATVYSRVKADKRIATVPSE